MNAKNELEILIADISRCWDLSQTPKDLRESFEAWTNNNKNHIDRLRAIIAATAAGWII